MKMMDIEKIVKDYAEARAQMMEHVAALERGMETVRKKYLPAIKVTFRRTEKKYEALMAAVESNPQLFKKPRTVVFHDVKVGLKKDKGKITWDDDEKVVSLISTHFPEMFETLVRTTHTPVKTALDGLPAHDLKKLAVTVTDDGDQVVIRPVDSVGEKFVKELLKDLKASGNGGKEAS
jgi:hypothetical protein